MAVLREEKPGLDGRQPAEGPDGGLHVRKEKSRTREESDAAKDKKDKKKR